MREEQNLQQRQGNCGTLAGDLKMGPSGWSRYKEQVLVMQYVQWAIGDLAATGLFSSAEQWHGSKIHADGAAAGLFCGTITWCKG
jgi:hypothetical protein